MKAISFDDALEIMDTNQQAMDSANQTLTQTQSAQNVSEALRSDSIGSSEMSTILAWVLLFAVVGKFLKG